MPELPRITAALGAAVLVAAPLTFLAAPAGAVEREFRCSGARVSFEVEREDRRRFEVELDIRRASAGERWRVVLRHDGTAFHKRRHRADAAGLIDTDKTRRNTAGRDVFRVTVKEIGGGKACSRTIRMR